MMVHKYQNKEMQLEDSIEMEFRKQDFECVNWSKLTWFVKQVYQELTLD